MRTSWAAMRAGPGFQQSSALRNRESGTAGLPGFSLETEGGPASEYAQPRPLRCGQARLDTSRTFYLQSLERSEPSHTSSSDDALGVVSFGTHIVHHPRVIPEGDVGDGTWTRVQWRWRSWDRTYGSPCGHSFPVQEAPRGPQGDSCGAPQHLHALENLPFGERRKCEFRRHHLWDYTTWGTASENCK